MEKKGRYYIATSGWYYEHWKGPFYPEDLPKSGFFPFYAQHFTSVELNNSFYRLPNEKTLARWREISPKGFIFAAKASRLITHNKKLKDPEATLPPFIERMDILGDKLGPILFQLPPSWGVNVERLSEFLDKLPPGRRYAFELRNTTWFDERVYGLLKKRGAAFCVYDFNFVQSPRLITADFAYIRLHGPAGSYRGQYSVEALRDWAVQIKRWLREVDTVYCYFDNDEAGYAAQDALRLNKMVKEKG